MEKQEAKNVVYFAENALSEIQGGGIVAYAVLKGLPREKLLGFYDYGNITPVPEYHDRFVRLKRWRLLENLLHAQPAIYEMVGKVHWVFSLFASIWFFLSNNMWLVLGFEFLSRKDVDRVRNQIELSGFRPQLVYFSGLSRRYLKLAVEISKLYDVPMVLLHMDNWMGREKHLLGNLVLGRYWFKKTVQCMREAAKRSLSCTTNSPGLSEIITDLTGYEHKPANNCCADLMPHASSLPVEGNDIPVITYVGAMNKTLQAEGLLTLSYAVAELNSEGLKVRLHIYTPWEFAPVANSIQVPNAVYYKGQLGRKELSDVYLRSDFLVTTTTYNPENLILFRYSLSTKLSEYLCVGKPVISMGHRSWHLHEYVQKHGCGFSIYDREVSKVKEELRKILKSDLQDLNNIGSKNRILWEHAHDVEVMSKETRAAVGL